MKPEKEWVWDSEAALCEAFRLWLPKEWVVYPETNGWDMLLVHREGGWQIGVEAKLSLNAKVLVQAMERPGYLNGCGPDFRAVLVGKIVAENLTIAKAMGLTVIAPKYVSRPDYGRGWTKEGPHLPQFHPQLPEAERLARIGDWWSDWGDHQDWFDRFPSDRLKLPEYVPEVAAGVPCPIILSDWKIKAMRVCIWVEKHQTITRPIFKKLGIDPSRWMTGHWLAAGKTRGDWIAGPYFPAPALRRDHPNIYAKIEADFPEWSKKVKP